MVYINKPTTLDPAQDVQNGKHQKIFTKLRCQNKSTPKPKITREHPYKGWGVSTNHGKNRQNPPVWTSTTRKN